MGMNYYFEAMNWLKSYNDLIIARENLTERINSIDDVQSEIKGISYSDMPTGNGTNYDDRFINNVFVKDKLKAELIDTEREIKNIKNSLAKLRGSEPILYRVLNEYYIDGKSAMQIADGLNVGDKYVYKLKSKGIRILGVQLFGINAVE